MPFATGATFAEYTILRLLGAGGMGEVYLAQHPRLPRRDALKTLGNEVSANDDYRKRFIREADLAAELWHPKIVRVNDRGEFNGRLWISMDFVDGTDGASTRSPVAGLMSRKISLASSGRCAVCQDCKAIASLLSRLEWLKKIRGKSSPHPGQAGSTDACEARRTVLRQLTNSTA
jgi:serine/threonine protein kinase